MPEKIPPSRPDYSMLSKVSSIGGCIVFLILLGHWLDQKFHTTAVFTLLGAGLGVIYSLYEAWRALK